MTHASSRAIVSGLAGVLASAVLAFAQEPPPPQTPPPTQAAEPARGQRGAGQRPGARQGLPPAGPNMTLEQLQDYLDVAAVIQAERRLQLTADQYPNFVARLRKVQALRRQHQQQRARLLRELRALVQPEAGPPFREEVISERLKTLDEINVKAAQELRQAYLDLDGILAPWQRARFRLLEEEQERQKFELLAKLRQAPGGGPPAPVPHPPK
jgi:hypothetical protein